MGAHDFSIAQSIRRRPHYVDNVPGQACFLRDLPGFAWAFSSIPACATCNANTCACRRSPRITRKVKGATHPGTSQTLKVFSADSRADLPVYFARRGGGSREKPLGSSQLSLKRPIQHRRHQSGLRSIATKAPEGGRDNSFSVSACVARSAEFISEGTSSPPENPREVRVG